MGTPELHLDTIRQRLIDLQAPASQPQAAVELPWGTSQSAELTANQPTTDLSATDLSATVEALRQRSATVAPDRAAPPQPEPRIPPDLDMHLHRLQGQARHINALAQEQEAALQAFKRSANSLAWHLQHHSSPWTLEQFCRLEAVGIAQVLADTQGAMVLTATAVDLHQDEQNAAQAAHLLRHRNRQAAWGETATGSSLFIREPIAALNRIWQGLTVTLEHHSRLSALDILGWLMGGIISRKVLELTLATLPSLWPLMIGGIIAWVCWALYRLITNPHSDLALISRILLALLGLVLGGQL
ncbi:MAG: hypothetical protein ACFB0C_16820 [Leptolyngbyaceae cyanobacterium]